MNNIIYQRLIRMGEPSSLNALLSYCIIIKWVCLTIALIFFYVVTSPNFLNFVWDTKKIVIFYNPSI